MDLSPTKQALLALRQMQSKLNALEQAKYEAIAIVGMGCRFPGANNPEEFWQLLEDGRDAITEIPAQHWNKSEYDSEQKNTPGKICTTSGGFVPYLREFDASFFRIAPREATSLDPQQRLLLEVSWEALENAAIPADQIKGSQTGVFIGISATDYWHQLLSRKTTEIDAYLTTGNTHSLASGRISHFFDLMGTSLSLDTACSSSLVAVNLAIKSLRDRECNMALVGGVNRLISPKISINFSRAKMLSPDGRCKTFDEDANGFVRSEGCGILVLKRLSDAIADQDRIRAVLLGSATNQDGRTSSITTPNSLSQQAVIKQALVNSRVTPQQVSYVETHGTGTSLGDAIEIEALTQVFKDHDQLILGAVKTNIGHLESASGIASLIKTVLALENELIPSNLHLKQPNSKLNWQNLPFKLPQKALAWSKTIQPRIAGVSGFGFSGTNAHVIVQEAATLDKNETGVNSKSILCQEDEPQVHLFTISAKSHKALSQLVNDYIAYLQSHPDSLIEDICYTVNIGRSHFNYRLATIITSKAELETKLTQYINQATVQDLWQGKVNPNRSLKLALVESSLISKELIELIESLIDSYLTSPELADVYWQIDNQKIIDNNAIKSIVYSQVNSELNTSQILFSGLAQLYILGAKINWDSLSKNMSGKKISLPTYFFQRQTYWI